MKLSATFVVLLIISCVYGEEKCGQKDSTMAHQDFGLPLTANDILTSIMSPWVFQDYFRPWRHLESLARDLGSTIKTDKDKFQINLDVQHFGPDEISVKTSDGYVVVEAKHEEKQDAHGLVSRQFVRRYSLPEGAESEDVVSELSSDGILTITAPRKEVDAKGVRVVPITKTGPARMEPKESAKECSGKEKCELYVYDLGPSRKWTIPTLKAGNALVTPWESMGGGDHLPSGEQLACLPPHGKKMFLDVDSSRGCTLIISPCKSCVNRGRGVAAERTASCTSYPFSLEPSELVKVVGVKA